MPWSRLSPADEQLLFWFMVAIQVGSAFMTVRLWRGDQRALAIIRQSLRAAPRGLTEGMLQALPFGYCSLWLVTLLCASFVYEHELQRLGPLALLCRPEIRRVFFWVDLDLRARLYSDRVFRSPANAHPAVLDGANGVGAKRRIPWLIPSL
jgi:hypothetical protein